MNTPKTMEVFQRDERFYIRYIGSLPHKYWKAHFGDEQKAINCKLRLEEDHFENGARKDLETNFVLRLEFVVPAKL